MGTIIKRQRGEDKRPRLAAAVQTVSMESEVLGALGQAGFAAEVTSRSEASQFKLGKCEWRATRIVVKTCAAAPPEESDAANGSARD